MLLALVKHFNYLASNLFVLLFLYVVCRTAEDMNARSLIDYVFVGKNMLRWVIDGEAVKRLSIGLSDLMNVLYKIRLD